MNKPLRLLTLALATLTPLLATAGEQPGNVPLGANVSELLRWADTHNPELAAMRYDTEAAGERVEPAGALPDPVLRTELQDFAGRAAPNGFTLSPSRAGATKYTLMQSIPFWGKRELRKEIAASELEQSRGRNRAAITEIHAQIKGAYAMYYQAVGLHDLTRDLQRLLADLEAVTQARYAGGLAPQQDVIRAQVEKTLLRSELIGLETERHHAQSRLNTALGRAAHTPLAEPQALRRVAVEKLDAVALEEKARRGSPLIATQAAQTVAAEANRRLVEKNRYPDVTLGLAPIQRGNGINSWEAMVEINIPIRLDSRRAQENAANATLSAARQREQAVANQVTAALQESLAAATAAAAQEKLIADTLLPQAELTFRSALAGYESGKVDFATLLDAQRAIKRARQDRIKAQVEQELRLTDIERMVGEEL